MADRLPAGKEGKVKAIEMLFRFENYKRYYQACYSWVAVFEKYGIAWIYCPESSRGGQLDLVADFYLPDQGAYLIVDSKRPERGCINCVELSERFKKLIVLAGIDGRFRIFENGEAYAPSESWLCKCAACRRHFFLNAQGSYVCKICGEYDGDHHISLMDDGYQGCFCIRR